jgi:CPA1 family monovalent cation:H+ antiporter
MALFESILTLLLLAIVLLQVSGRLGIPYPTMLALAGVAVAALPWAPAIHIDSNLVMTLFIAPAILDAAFDFPKRALKRFWIAFIALAVLAVVVTAAAVAWAAVGWAHIPLAAAVALGAIVAPPDAAAATAIMRQVSLPRDTVLVLAGESLLNDAVALLIFGVAVAAAMPNASGDNVWTLAVSIPGGLLVGFLVARIVIWVMPFLVGTLGGILFQFVATYATWMIAHALHFSSILAVVAAAMTLSTQRRYRPPARDRIHSYSMWGTVVFVLNVMAFLLVGLQAREAITNFPADALWKQIGFAAAILGVVIGVRIVWLAICNVGLRQIYRWLGHGKNTGPTAKQSAVGAWCGMRGMVTLAAALALPPEFPARGTILLSALMVVLGTLIVQGLTLGPFIRWLKFEPDGSRAQELADTRRALLEASLSHLADRNDDEAKLLKQRYAMEHTAAQNADSPFDIRLNALELECVAAQRTHLQTLRGRDSIDEDIYQLLEMQLDLAEVRARSPVEFGLRES